MLLLLLKVTSNSFNIVIVSERVNRRLGPKNQGLNQADYRGAGTFLKIKSTFAYAQALLRLIKHCSGTARAQGYSRMLRHA